MGGASMVYKILIVDDEKMMTELLSDHLRDCGYEAITANSSRDAIELLQKNPDLIRFYNTKRKNFGFCLTWIVYCIYNVPNLRK